MSNIIIKDHGETIFSSRDNDDYIFDLDQMKIYDWYDESVRCVLDLGLEGPAAARLIYLLSYRYLNDNGLRLELVSEDLRT